MHEALLRCEFGNLCVSCVSGIKFFCGASCRVVQAQEAPEEFAVRAKVGRFCLVSPRRARSSLHNTDPFN